MYVHAMENERQAIRPQISSVSAPPAAVEDGAKACVEYVEKKYGIKLDFQIETLPILDHYLREARDKSVPDDAKSLVASVAGCYFGEVLRSRFPLTWDPADVDHASWSMSTTYVTVFPVAMARVAIDGVESERVTESLRLDPKLSASLAHRLRQLPPVSEDEFTSLSTRLEVLDIAFELLASGSQTASHHDGACCDDSEHAEEPSNC